VDAKLKDAIEKMGRMVDKVQCDSPGMGTVGKRTNELARRKDDNPKEHEL